ncbi:MAG TPA: 1,6-anhydro-N-acetylmuramyl-L-alanine amidase AmpD [Gammaproteobacteria bacterium]|jgi:AmpD protein
MHVDRESGLLGNARQVASPNSDARPAGAEPELIVIHGISLPPGQYGGPWIDALFTNTLDPAAAPYFAGIHQLRVSAHLLIRRDGEVVQYVPFHRRAWHAGVSHYAGRERCNDFSVGIELEGSDDEPYEPVQYLRLAEVIAALEQAYPRLSRERLVGHSDIAPGRKSDPGAAFDWHYLHSLLSSFGRGENSA